MYSRSCASFSAHEVSRVMQLREARDPRLDDQALPVLGYLLAELSKKAGRIGRGPTIVMSPQHTFHS